MWQRVPRRLLLIGLSLVGLLGAHFLAFVFAAPHVHERTELLTATGHGSWLPLTIAALTSVLISSLRTGGSGLTQLALLQTTGFVAMEMTERIGTHSLDQLVGESAFHLGLVLQIFVALLITLLVRYARTVVVFLKGRIGDPPGSGSSPPLRHHISHVGYLTSVARSAWNLRGPPLPHGSR